MSDEQSSAPSSPTPSMEERINTAKEGMTNLESLHDLEDSAHVIHDELWNMIDEIESGDIAEARNVMITIRARLELIEEYATNNERK